MFDPDTVSWVFTEDDLGFLTTAIETATEVVMDLETTGLEERAVLGGKLNGGYPARIVLAALTLPQEDDADPLQPTTYVVPLSHPDSPFLGQWRTVMARIARTIIEFEKPVSNQNVKFDCRWVHAHTHLDLSGRIVWDTRIGAHLMDETISTKLKVGVPRDFGVSPWDEFDLSTPGAAERVPLFELGIYAAQDTYWTFRWERLQKQRMHLIDTEEFEPETPEEIEMARLGKLATWCSIPTTATLTAIEQRGFGVDVEWVRAKIDHHEARRDELTDHLASLYPGLRREDASWAPTSHWFMEWTEKAVEAGDLRIAAMTGTGRPSWTKGVLTRQSRSGSEVARDLLEVRSMVKQLEFLRIWRDCEVNGRVYTTYNAGSVVTGRLSSSGPNMQQVTKVLRPAFIPSPGKVIADFDYSQLELRIAAFVSRSPTMREAFQSGRDLHMMMAMEMTRKAMEDVLPHERQGAKAGNFGLLYGMGAMGLREYAENNYGVSFTEEEAYGVYEAFFSLWGLRDWHHRVIRRVHETGQVVSPIGRVRRLPQVYSDNPKMVSFGERAAINSPVQGFGSDLMQIAAASVEGNIPGHSRIEGVELVATVHDSIVAELPEDNWEPLAREVQRRMVEAVPRVLLKMDCKLDVPLAADVKVGTRWGLSDVGEL